jgi:hypothetical protein
MTGVDANSDLLIYLQGAREALLWKLDGLGEYEYFGPVFGRPHEVPLPWLAKDADPNADMWATPEQSTDEIVALYHRAWQHADETIAVLPLDAVGRVPWWGEDGEVTLHRVVVHMTAETQRHAGHADIVRELIDGTAGLLKGSDNLPSTDQDWWRDYSNQVDLAARSVAGH